MGRERVIVLFDPIHPYGVAYLEAARARGVRTVCLWTSRNNRTGTYAFPVLRSRAVAGHYALDPGAEGLERVARTLRERHQVVAVVPHVEPGVAPSIALAGLLGLSWAQPEVMWRFRDKHALKAHLGSRPDAPRVNRVRLVASPEEVRVAMADLDLDQVVLKPNDGYGNASIGFFDRSTTDAELAAHLAPAGGPMLLEERLVGPEFLVNGQVNASGHVDVYRIGAYVRALVNGRPNVELGERAVLRSEPEFGPIHDYARDVVRATGVRRTPFHLECIVDAKGPCLVEVAARLSGGDSTFDSHVHGTNIIDAALAQYLDDGTDETVPLDWERYDSEVVGQAAGYSVKAGRIARIRGYDRAEALPGLVRWHVRPAVGDKVVRTVDLSGTTWEALVAGPDAAAWRERVEAIRAAVQYDVVGDDEGRSWRWARATAPALVRAVRRAWSFARTR